MRERDFLPDDLAACCCVVGSSLLSSHLLPILPFHLSSVKAIHRYIVMNIHSAMTTSTPRLFFALFLICSAISEPEDLCSCPLFQSERDDFQVGNVVILSATGRVGSSNLLAMLGSHPRIRDLGEIFIASQFRSLGLPLNKKSPRETPAPGHHKRRMVTHIIERMKSSHSRLRSESGTLNRLASVKFWHAWENGVDIAWMVRHLHSCG